MFGVHERLLQGAFHNGVWGDRTRMRRAAADHRGYNLNKDRRQSAAVRVVRVLSPRPLLQISSYVNPKHTNENYSDAPHRPGEKRSTGISATGPINPDSCGVQRAAVNKPSGPAFS